MRLGLYSIRYDAIDFKPCGLSRINVLAVLRRTFTDSVRVVARRVLAGQVDFGPGVEVLLPRLLEVGDGIAR